LHEIDHLHRRVWHAMDGAMRCSRTAGFHGKSMFTTVDACCRLGRAAGIGDQDGGCHRKKRPRWFEKAVSGRALAASVFLSTDAGSTGLNLQHASTV